MTMRLFLLGISSLSTAMASSQSSLQQLESFWIDPVDVLNNLDDYQAIWIKPHGCVWSECEVDDTDDRYMGDNRDGDEKWYQYRTQAFCANAAYSLYGSKKGTSSWFGCSRSHFINSFFTYGGADNLLKAAGKTPTVFYDNGNNGNNNNNTSSSANSVCVEIDLEDGRRDLNSRDNNKAGYVSTLGCNADGSYAIAGFEANECDGNYFKDILDPFEAYNDQHESIGCHLMWSQNKKRSSSKLNFLLTNSWSCDLDLYPNGCPDPYGEKERWDYAIRTVARGGNAELAYKNMMYKRPLRILSCFFAVLATATLVAAYLVRNRERIHSKGGRYMGVLRCVLEDIIAQGIAFKNGIKKAVRAQRENLRRNRKRRRAKKKEEEEEEGQGDGVWVGASPMDEVDESESSSKKAREKKRRRERRKQRKAEEASAAEGTDLEDEAEAEVAHEANEPQEPTDTHEESPPQWPEDDHDDRQVV